MPGEMLLVLGRPGRGTSAFLRALADQKRGLRVLRGMYTTLRRVGGGEVSGGDFV